MKCNKCKSSNVQKYQVIHEQGTSSINLDSNTAGGGVGFGGGLRGALGVARTGTSGKTQTIIAEKTKPLSFNTNFHNPKIVKISIFIIPSVIKLT